MSDTEEPRRLVERIGRENYDRAGVAHAHDALSRLAPAAVTPLVEVELVHLDALIERSQSALVEYSESEAAQDQFEGQIAVFETGKRLLRELLTEIGASRTEC